MERTGLRGSGGVSRTNFCIKQRTYLHGRVNKAILHAGQSKYLHLLGESRQGGKGRPWRDAICQDGRSSKSTADGPSETADSGSPSRQQTIVPGRHNALLVRQHTIVPGKHAVSRREEEEEEDTPVLAFARQGVGWCRL